MAKSETVSLNRVLDEGFGEDEYVAASSALVKKIYDKSHEWKNLILEEEEPSKVKSKAEEVAMAANALEEIQRVYRTPHPVEHSSDRRENFEGVDSDLLIKSNQAIAYAHDLGTASFYEFQDPEDIGEGEFCILEETDYATPGEVLDEMPDMYTRDLIKLDFSVDIDDLPWFEDYRSLPGL